MKRPPLPFFLTSLLIAPSYAELPAGILGGVLDDNGAYSSFLFTSEKVNPISGLPENAEIYAVSINSSGTALIGGYNYGTDALYLSSVNPNGTVSESDFAPDSLIVTSTAINELGQGLFSAKQGINTGYAAFLIDNSITELSDKRFYSVALNDDGVGLIGGEGQPMNDFPSALYVYADGTTPLEINLEGLPGGVEGAIYSVAINPQANGIVGGFHSHYDGEWNYNCYAAFVSPDGSSTEIASLPSSHDYFNSINAVAINNSNLALIGGRGNEGNGYAAYVEMGETPTLSPLFSTPFDGEIYSVSLNDTGTGLIGGEKEGKLYAAFVQPGSVQTILSDDIEGQINSVSLSPTGVGLIGGQIEGIEGYAALVAPNGAVTVLSLSNVRDILSVDILNVLEATPQVVGPFSSVPFTQLALSSTLHSRFIDQNRTWQTGSQHRDLAYHPSLDMDTLLASNQIKNKTSLSRDNSIWMAPFGNWIYLGARGSLPSYRNQIGGLLLGYDRQEDNYMIGAALGYAFNAVQYGNRLGHGKVQEEMACLYGSYYTDHFWFGATLWGGIYQFYNTRHTIVPAEITSKGSTHGGIVSPHIEMASPWAMDGQNRYFVEPFFSFDWVNSWQHSYKEKGSSGLNLRIPDWYSSLLQSEIGLRFYEQFGYGWGEFCLEEKISYINQAPFNFNSVPTSFVGSASSFPIAVGSVENENLAGFELFASFEPKNRCYPYGGLNFQFSGNRTYQSYFITVFSGKDF